MDKQSREPDRDSEKPQVDKEDERPSTSFPARLASSASGLFQDAFSARGSSAAEALSSALSAGGKAESGHSTPAEGSLSRRVDSSSYHPSSIRNDSLASGFSEGDTRRSVAQPELGNDMTLDQFLEQDVDLEALAADDTTAKGKGKQVVHTHSALPDSSSAQHTSFESAWQKSALSDNRSSEAARMPDGEAVVRLLSDPNFDPKLGWDERGTCEPIIHLTEQERLISAWFTQTFSNPSSSDTLTHAIATAKQNRPFAEFASVFDEIEAYHEEVWGYLEPIVQAARKEAVADGETAIRDGPATRRLRMLLAHLHSSA